MPKKRLYREEVETYRHFLPTDTEVQSVRELLEDLIQRVEELEKGNAKPPTPRPTAPTE